MHISTYHNLLLGQLIHTCYVLARSRAQLSLEEALLAFSNYRLIRDEARVEDFRLRTQLRSHFYISPNGCVDD